MLIVVMEHKEKRILQIVIWNCRNCPYLRYYAESGCRVYTPAHYSCDAVPDGKNFSTKICDVDELPTDDIPIPSFCPIPIHKEPYTVCGNSEWLTNGY